jgi:eukaryotic-like serine/threonine-protein kinase
LVGQTISHYRITDKLGEGGMGVVYKAEDTHLDRFVAIKVLPPEKVANPERKRRFVQEARAASALNHPNIITVHDIDSSDGVVFMVMEYVAGKPLNELIRRGRVRLNEALQYAVQIADALSAAHEADIVHRDLKPGNIMLGDDDRIRVLDFGLAKLVEAVPESDQTRTIIAGEAPLTEEGRIVGTVSYMSPEQAEGRKVDARSDIFTFGSVLYEMVTGRRAFRGESSMSTLAAIIKEEPRPILEITKDVPVEVERVIRHCLRKDPKRRFQHMDDVRSLLAELQEESDSGVVPAVTSENVPSIAVLPFLNMSRDEEDEYFGDGLTEELINALTQLQGLRVVSRTSVFQFKGVTADVCEVGRKLRTENVLEGSVRRAGSRIRVTAQLVNVADGYHLWSQRYDREMKDIFDLQDELARAIVETLEVKLVGEQKRSLVKPRPGTPEAYDLCLRGRHLMFQFTRKRLERSIEYFERAAREDPGCALAYAGSAFANANLAIFGWSPPWVVMKKAKQAALAALRIDDTDAESHRVLALVRHWHDWNWTGAEEEYRRTIALQPGDARAYERYAELLTHVGRFDEAIALLGEALKSDPVSLEANQILGNTLFLARRYDETIDHLRKAQELAPTCFLLEIILGQVYCAKGQYEDALQSAERALSLAAGEPFCLALFGYVNAKIGRHEEARKMLERFEQWRTETYFSPVLINWIYLGLGQTEDALQWLQTACEERDPLCSVLKVTPFADLLRPERRFQSLLRKIGFKPDQ